MRLSLACLALALSSSVAPVSASDGHTAPANPAPANTAASGPGTAAASPRKDFQDPMDRLRERLAQKLAAGGAIDAPAPNMIRVVNRSAGTTTVHPVPAVAPAAAQREHPQGGSTPPPAHASHWDYQGPGGPANWGQLKPEFATCATGVRQSPIDIRDGIKVQLDLVQFDYRASSFRVIDNGHTVQVDVGAGNAIEVLGRRYELLQFHFHRPSEERIEGRQFAMVAHLVHKSADGRLAVVAVLIEQGRAHPIVQAVWNNLPLDKGEDVAARASLDLSGLLPEDRSYFTYMGSLTTPPCSEGVLWMVMRQPVQVSPEQIGVFARLYPMNARPVQQAGGRLIKQSD
jgi:carbonic anhydrase